MNRRLLQLVYAGLLAAITCLLTFALHIPVSNGYIHFGDAVIYLAAAMLPMPYAAGAAAVGGALADVLSGYSAYALPTFLIKAVLAMLFSAVGGASFFCKRRVLACVLCGIVSVLGYWLTAIVLYGGALAQLIATAPGNVMQGLISALVYCACAIAFDRLKLPSFRKPQ